MDDSPEDPAFQKKFNAFYRVRRSEAWRTEYFKLMAAFRKKNSVTFGEILLRLFQNTGQIEASFGSKMLATSDPDMPIWDSNVLKSLQLQLKGDMPELRMSNTVVLYDHICRWYKSFLQTKEAEELLLRFDREFPEFHGLSDTKKIDFVLWASQ